MATEQEKADAAYRQYENARQAYNAIAGSPMGGAVATQARERLAQAEAASNAANAALTATYTTPAAGGGGGGETPTETAEDQYWNWRRQQDDAADKNARNSLIQQITGMFNEYGLGSLYGTIVKFVQQGYSGDAIALLLRDTPEYKERFPAMSTLSAKGRAISEGEYIAYERKAAGLERAYGLPAGMLGKDAITRLIGNEVSGDELENRVTMAAAGAFQTSQEVRDTFAQYYGIGSGGLTAYFLDPDQALPLLERQYVSSQIGAEAALQDITVQAMTAERLFEGGVTREQARQGFGEVARMGALTQGRGDVVSQEQLISGTLENNEEAQSSIERAQRARMGRFQGGGGFAAGQQGVTGLGSAATR